MCRERAHNIRRAGQDTRRDRSMNDELRSDVCDSVEPEYRSVSVSHLDLASSAERVFVSRTRHGWT